MPVDEIDDESTASRHELDELGELTGHWIDDPRAVHHAFVRRAG